MAIPIHNPDLAVYGDAERARNGSGIGIAGDPMFSLETRQRNAIAFQTSIARNGRGQPSEVVSALASCGGGMHSDSKPHVAYSGGVRRLTPRECERLQGFPDDWTSGDITPISDSARYRALGNAVAVPVAHWIGRRLMEGVME